MTKGNLLRFLLTASARKNRLPGGRCSCHQTTVRWCTRHGRPVPGAQRRVDQLALT